MDELPDIGNENEDAIKNDVFRVYVWLFWSLIGSLIGPLMVRDGRYTSTKKFVAKKMVNAVIFGVEYLILVKGFRKSP